MKKLKPSEQKKRWIDYINNPYQTYTMSNGMKITIKVLPEYDL